MPRKGRLPSSARPSAGRSPRRSRFSIASWNAPSPGSATASASSTARGSWVTTAGMPTRANAFSTEPRLPRPSTTAIIGSQGSLRGREDTRDPRIDARRFGESATDRLELCLRDVVEVVAVVHGHVQRELGVEGEGAEELLEQVEVEVRHARPRHRHAEDEERPARQVHRRGDERLVHRDERGAVADDALFVAERQPERLPEHDADVLDRVMLVHFDVPLRLDGEVHQAVLRPRLEHVAEERDWRLHLRGAGAVEVELERDLRLLGLALDAGLPCRRLRAHSLLPGSFPSRSSAARPCPASPSIRVSVLRWGAAAASPRSEYSMTLERLTKSSVPSGDAKRAVPAVGRTWLGPAT